MVASENAVQMKNHPRRLSCPMFLLGLLFTCQVKAQDTDLYSCLEDHDFCSETQLAIVDSSSCGRPFYYYKGRLSWTPLRNVGPITVEVWTRGGYQITPWPLYVELVQFPSGSQDSICTTTWPGKVVLVAQGAGQCEGVWETFGPLDLTQVGIRLGARYGVQVQGFESRRDPDYGRVTPHSVGLACIRVTSHADTTAVTQGSWTLFKSLYR